MLFVQHNLLAENANRQLNVNTKKNAKTTEKLSSGYRINRAADDAAGLAISEKMRRQVRGLNQTISNITDGVGYVQTAEGALNEVDDMLQRMNELAVKSANGTHTESDREDIDREIQQLKAEMDRIFSTTTFNEQRIWEVEESKEILGYKKEIAVKFTESTTYFDITNENCGVIAQNGYKINADKKGVMVSWTGYNGKTYNTETIDWDTIEKNNYSFELSDHFQAKDTDLISPTTGEKLIKHKVSMNVNSFAKEDEEHKDLIAAIDGCILSRGVSSPISNQLEDVDGDPAPKKWLGTNQEVKFYSYLNYDAAYKSHIGSKDGYDFDTEKDGFIKPTITNGTNLKYPSATNAGSAVGSDEKWKFSFYMEGIGPITAESSSISYSSPDKDSNKETIWWHWVYPKDSKPYKSTNTYPSPNTSKGTLGDVMKALTGTYGLLDEKKGGNTKGGGSITLNFTLKSGDESIGQIHTTIPVLAGVNGDNEQAVLDRINDVFNGSTILDIFTTESNVKANSSIYKPSDPTYKMDVPIYGGPLYGGTRKFFVQAGVEAGQHIDIEYDSLSVFVLGMQDTNVLTVEDSGNAINEIKAALRTVSEQRSTFGAYQNRLEHARNNNGNVEENTQAAESLIRDADIADLMMEFSVNNILMQAGTSMLTQANQSNQLAVELLQ